MNASGEPSSTVPDLVASGADAALVARLAARDTGALRDVIALHAAMLNRIAFRMTGDAHEAEDIAQEAMLRLWDQAQMIAARHPVGSQAAGMLRLGGWLNRVATNLAIDRLRRARRLSHGAVPDCEDDAPLADMMIETGEREVSARTLVAALPERQRAAIVLTYYEEFSNAAAAETLDMNIKAFESLLQRARSSLRKAFAAEAEGGLK
jgi:RNA polymerase sigma-70 factor (ECF subfamily)